MIIVNSFEEMRTHLKKINSLISFVPTMGSLHDGHLTLIDKAKNNSKYVIASIFVNRLQFGPKEDFEKYPRVIDNDVNLLSKTNLVDLLFIPQENEVYPFEQSFYIHPANTIANDLEGKFRPNFFSGVCTVLLKFFSNINPDIVILGKKDFQQFVIVENMCRQFRLPIKVIGQDTVRCSDGLAFSSRNVYLSQLERIEAPYLYNTLLGIKKHIGLYPDLKLDQLIELENKASAELNARGWQTDYISIRRRSDLSVLNMGDLDGKEPLVVLGAATLGNTRLIDNIEI
ncbi:pantoate--beta-alanine ligase [Candidatus Kinetoplastidibacterium crithidiae]|uniref:Pantothenate synthetase n=1 Tax=Candidatus Kinetoplastidibacterium crithidiae TCC036E TaxID=1208918 RepID=M1L5J4_9PROT|nr:pantoate--beta-alanine ligase [Candidatus Kinetoplastibacterium crithidii]AFZ82907.1 pantoate--beta-alanine ligase [Candidatus Kinetoplastibacterium crithidii (ex Angomonas deanei ATCC 30255)]AGF47908.1 pantoate--beta-alanine ligase [Candidatus Kinetoplastibacterium crithidii TCC036E]